MSSEKTERQTEQTVPEEQLVRRAQQRDADAWTELYNRYADRLYRYILARLRNTMIAEDLTEQVFMKALNSISSFTWKGDPFSAWLFRIAHNLIVDFYRKPSSKEQSLPEWDLPLSGADPVQIAEATITMETVLQTLESLTGAQRQVIELRFVADLSIEDTARIMGKKPGAIKALQHAAIESLQRRLLSVRGEDE